MMKTAEDYKELYNKHKIGNWIDLIGLKNAIQEYDKEILKLIDNDKKQAVSKMGSTGADGYWDNATKDEIWEFGRYRAFEDIYDLLTEK